MIIFSNGSLIMYYVPRYMHKEVDAAFVVVGCGETIDITNNYENHADVLN